MRGQGALIVASVLGAAAFVATGLGEANAQSTPTRHKAVLELFTSQGCSSCPAADALLGQYAKRQDVIALSLPVDYWDYLGWKDTLASPAYSARQRAYSKTRGDNMVYTPQLVVNGLLHVNGAHKGDIESAIIATKKQLDKNRVALSLKAEGDSLKVEIGQAEGKASGIVWLLLVKEVVPVSIGRGENSGKRITYYNVVRSMTPVGRWSGEATTLTLPLSKTQAPDADGWVVLLQQGETGPVIAGADHK